MVHSSLFIDIRLQITDIRGFLMLKIRPSLDGALNYYSSFEREFSEFERHSLEAICGIAGMIISATEAEAIRLKGILDQIGTGVTLIGLPPDWEKRKLKRNKGNTRWNLDINMPLLFLNRIHDEIFSPQAKKGMDCYKAFNDPAQRRPCSWCPTIRAISSGQSKTFYTHSPAPPKNRIEHFKVTASILRKSGRPVAAIESTVPVTRELEGRNLSTRLLETDDEDEVLGLAAECLGRGTRNDCILIIPLDKNSKGLKIDRIYTVDREVLKEERAARPEWKKDTLSDDFPPLEEYFVEREQKGHRLFKKRLQHSALRKPLGPCAKEIILKAMNSGEVFVQIQPERFLEFFRGTTLLSETHFRNCHRGRPPRAVILRIGSRRNPLACVVMLDEKPWWPCFEEPGHGRHWCTEIASELATKIEGIRLSRNLEQLAQFREAVIEKAPVGVILTDGKGKITRVNRAWCEMAGGDATGRNLFRLKSIQKAGLAKEFRKALKGNVNVIEIPERRFYTEFGRGPTVSAKCVPLSNEKQEVSGLLISCWDLTEVARYYKAAANLREARALGNLAAGAVHEIRTPAQAIKYSAKEIIRKVPRLLGDEHKLITTLSTVDADTFFTKVQETVSERVNPEAIPILEASQKTLKTVKSVLQHFGVPQNDDIINRLARVGLAPVLYEVLGLNAGQHAETILSYFENLSSIVLSAESVYLSISQINELIEALESQSYIAPSQWQKVNIEHTLEGALVILRHVLEEYDTIVNKYYSPYVKEVLCIPGQLGQVWRNLLQNSLDSITQVRRRGIIDIITKKRGGNLIVTIRDNGGGIPGDIDISRIGTSLPKLEETALEGLGLWLVRTIIAKHRGRIKICSRRGEGTWVDVILPITN